MESNNLLAVGSTLQWGRYRVERHLASGGFGNTYVVTQVKLNKQRAMKEFFMRGVNARQADGTVSVSNEENAPSFQSQMNKFVREAERLAAFENDHIVRVQDCFDENGTAYYVMDYIDGCSLSELLQKKGRALTEAEVEPILAQVLDALEAVHNHKDADGNGLLHLDLKPGNIMINAEGHVWLIDFGASKQFTSSEAHLTLSSTMMMTPSYAPSEQVNRNAKAIGPWTDFYALGATLYKLLTNATPPPIDDIVDDPEALRLPSSVSSRMSDLIRWLMQPSRSKRPQSVAEIRHFIGSFSKPEPPVKAPEVPKPTIEATIVEKPDIAPKEESTIVDEIQITSEPQQLANNENNAVKREKILTDNSYKAVVIVVVFIFAVVMAVLLTKHGDSNKEDAYSEDIAVAAIDADYVVEENPFDVAYNAFLAIQNNDIEGWKERLADFDDDCVSMFKNDGALEEYIEYAQSCELEIFQNIRERINKQSSFLRINEDKYLALRDDNFIQQQINYGEKIYNSEGQEFIWFSYECRFIILDGEETSYDIIFIHKPNGEWKISLPLGKPEAAAEEVAAEEVAEDYVPEEEAAAEYKASAWEDEAVPEEEATAEDEEW